MLTRKDRSILIVEDEMLVRLVGSDILSDAGYEVAEAETAEEALQFLERHGEVAVLFTDIRMPGSIDGLALAKIVHERWPSIKLLITSGDTFPSKSQVPDDGQFIRKPYSVDQLRREIAALVQDA